MYSHIEQLVAEIRTRDHELALVARGRINPNADRPDGYPRGGDSSGRMTGIADPTGSAVEQREAQADKLRQHADQAFASVHEALRALSAAHTHTVKALEPPKIIDLVERRPDDSVWCISCLRHRPDNSGKRIPIAFEPRTLMTGRSRDDLCSWCLRRWEGSSDEPARRTLPDIRFVIWRAEHPGRYLTEPIERDLLTPASKSSRSA